MIPVAFSLDHNFVMPTGVALLSILDKSQDCDLDIFILHNNSVSSEDKDMLIQTLASGNLRSNRLTFIEMGNSYDGAFVTKGITHTTYYRLQLPWLLPQYDKVIYCDGDLVFKRSIKELYNVEIGDHYCAGVKRYKHDGYSYKRHARRFGLEPSEYINAGVLVLNLKRMRQDCLNIEFEKLSSQKFPYSDQDILNIVCKGKIYTLPIGYNVTPSVDVDEKNIFVIHYAGLKPWRHFVHHWADWWNVYKTSIFYDPQLERSIVERPFGLKQTLKMNVKWYHPSVYKKLRRLLGQRPI